MPPLGWQLNWHPNREMILRIPRLLVDRMENPDKIEPVLVKVPVAPAASVIPKTLFTFSLGGA
jgi:hypothetical protein